ncbi:MAG: alkaline phosphatase [Bacteroidales bacterium]|nr:alkaline phosphatase [Bacteroidales bacterium]MDZ4203936.1 alkaline phosphatase [Bacteroidales bacterium]
MRKIVSFLILISSLFFLSTTCPPEPAEKKTPKNIIIFVGDGMGFNHIDVASIYLHGDTGKFVFQGKNWSRFAQATYPAMLKVGNQPEWAQGYNPHAAWNEKGYLEKDHTDSGAGGTTLSTGLKTYRGSIGMGIYGDTLLHLSQYAKQLGKAAGVVSSVQFTHATPASFTTHNLHRNNYAQIAQSMILKSQLDVIMGAGNPDYDNSGEPLAQDYKYVGGKELWNQLRTKPNSTTFLIKKERFNVGDINGDGVPDPWTFISDSANFAALSAGINIPKRVLGLPRVHSTLQQGRSGSLQTEPFKQPRVSGVPTLEQMTLGALNVLNQNEKGFFLMVEGGAIDWASHDNHSGRMIEEMDDFVSSIEAAVKWIEKNSNWDETLIIITADHETGMLWGPADGNNLLTPIVNKGKGILPGLQWHSIDHTNSLVPLFLRGKGSDMISIFLDEFDPVRGPFVQNAEVANLAFLLWGRF